MPTETKTIAGVECHRCEPMAAWLPLASCLRQREDAILARQGHKPAASKFELAPYGSPCLTCKAGDERSGGEVAPLPPLRERSNFHRLRRKVVPVGARFGSLVVTGECYVHHVNRYSVAPVRCDCGNELHARVSHLRSGDKHRCGLCGQRSRSKSIREWHRAEAAE